MRVGPDGRPGEIELLRRSGQHVLDTGALRIARAMRFEPARLGDFRVPVWVTQPLRYHWR